ncbi:MAG: phosphoribosylglycinamide formyltransferase [Flavobacteriales bacterium]
MKTRIAIFASGAGTNARNIISHFKGHSSIEIVLVISTNVQAGVVEVASENNIPCFVFEDDEANDAKLILDIIRNEEINFVVLSGYMRKIPDAVTRALAGRMVNIHPALLPKFGGKGMFGKRVHQAVKDAGEKETGITIHFVNEHYDEGAVIFQAVCPVNPHDSIEDIQKKVHTLEYQYYPTAIEQTIRGIK